MLLALAAAVLIVKTMMAAIRQILDHSDTVCGADDGVRMNAFSLSVSSYDDPAVWQLSIVLLIINVAIFFYLIDLNDFFVGARGCGTLQLALGGQINKM